ncbi:hypothetical protein HNQ77_000376 [Silvibacterium bohemicum]|uniref:DUF4157 domain-containing protein n=1 Tax=Silvibacterium bohemicum TaxID=1577686 RepID=A0A841JVH5_9BACT|nr:hypothetical protein [Silvibacterium bohemicum]MBB6142438.1 hypothetical protein [Silvibacterium bohemicum]
MMTHKWRPLGVLTLTLAATLALRGQAAAPANDTNAQTPSAQSVPDAEKPVRHITPAQAKELFASVDTILRFASDDSKLPVKSKVKRRLTTRNDVEKYLVEKMKDDKDAKRMERSEIVLKKFGLLDQSFHLEPFLVSLLKEQIAGYYDSKTKTVNLLDWIDPESQKPVLAHELTHALQDQRMNLEKWEDSDNDNLATNVAEDNHHISIDEQDTAREAVLEGQAMAVLVDYSLKPMGQSILTNPAVVKQKADEQGEDSDSPVLSRAPLLLQESLLFPYKEGLKFEVDLLADKGAEGAFAGVLDRPPASSYEIMNPHAYERKVKAPVLTMPDVHSLLDADYAPYDVGVMGQIDVRILSELFGGPQAAAALTPAWNGGIYYAVQKKDAPDKNSTASVGLLYLSQWKSPEAAAAFAKMYGDELDKQYDHVSRDTQNESDESEHIYKTSEGPMLLSTSGNSVFISESFDLTLARKLEFLMLGAQQSSTEGQSVAWSAVPRTGEGKSGMPSLTGPMMNFFAGCGVMRAALPAARF